MNRFVDDRDRALFPIRVASQLSGEMTGVFHWSGNLPQPRDYYSLADVYMNSFLKTRKWKNTNAVHAFDAALAELKGNGVVVIHNGPCCNACVGAYLWGEVVPSELAQGRSPSAFVFYNEQSSSTVRDGGDLWLVCGPIPESELGEQYDAQCDIVSQMILSTLAKYGFDACTEDSPDLIRMFVDVGVERIPERTQSGRTAKLKEAGACPQCSGLGSCFCIRRGPGDPTGCVRCGGSGKCRTCDGSGDDRKR